MACRLEGTKGKGRMLLLCGGQREQQRNKRNEISMSTLHFCLVSNQKYASIVVYTVVYAPLQLEVRSGPSQTHACTHARTHARMHARKHASSLRHFLPSTVYRLPSTFYHLPYWSAIAIPSATMYLRVAQVTGNISDEDRCK